MRYVSYANEKLLLFNLCEHSASVYNVGKADTSCEAYRVEDQNRSSERFTKKLALSYFPLPVLRKGERGGWSIIEIC